MYAIQLADYLIILRDDPALGIVLAQHTSRETVQVGRERFDEEAVLLHTQGEQADALIAIVRRKYRRDQLRIWHNATGAKSAWRKV